MSIVERSKTWAIRIARGLALAVAFAALQLALVNPAAWTEANVGRTDVVRDLRQWPVVQSRRPMPIVQDHLVVTSGTNATR